MTPYPPAFPLDSAKLILGRLTGSNTAALKELTYAEWELQGYVFSQVFGGGPVVWAVGTGPELTDTTWDCKAEFIAELQTYCAVMEQPGVSGAGAVNWTRWLQLILKLLPLILAEEQK